MKLETLKSSKFEAFKKSELQTAMMRAITGGDIYAGSFAGSTETAKTYDAAGCETGCKQRFDTQVTDPITLTRSYVWGDWGRC